ncbi:uncharacterized protein LOC125227413 [Leguminivora glycinivorella]|uniref:uncharacterized protein LOC125227413 n=1 Tax=Leguminivora glycinivorella TaxID=1035111 RepID=UPI00200E5F16|nr:uncharacterized protein LOC125227413 [Leguminivora glycinivorella]
MDAKERKQQVAVLCCDLSKAFDVADHGVITEKLRYYGINGSPLSLFESMLRDRSQIVVGDGGRVKSDPLEASMGVAQGSSVSNLLFSLLLNDLPESIDTAEVLMYADDVAAIVTAPTVESIEQKLNQTTAQLAEWFDVNGLSLNLKKTHYLVFNLAGRTTRPLTVKVGNEVLEQTTSTNFLGFEMDTCLAWNQHVDKLCGKLGSACYALGRVARTVSAEATRTCYFATVHSLLQYGAEFWGRCADWERAFRLQKRAVRIIAGVPHDTHAKPLFIKLGILTLPAVVILRVALYMRANLASFKTFGMLNSYETRNADKIIGVGRKLTKSSKLTHVMGPTVYNKLPKNIIDAPSLSSFKFRLKQWLIEQSFYSYNEFIAYKA